MMLYELFSWVKNSETELLFNSQTLTRVVFESEHKHALVARRELRADVCAARFFEATTTTVGEQAKRIEHHDAYMNFMAFCKVELGQQDYCNSFLIALKYLLLMPNTENLPAINEAKINSIFFILLKENKEKILEFYHQNQQLFNSFQQIKTMVAAAEIVTVHLAEVTSKLHAQENAISVAPLFMTFMDDTELFAAAILWLLLRGVPAERIIQTDLLQHFMLLYSAWLGTLDSPIKYLYGLLGAFPEAQDLIAAAGKVQCEDRSLHCEEGGKHSWAITGVLTEQSTLHRVEINVSSLEFTPTEENFEALYQLFGSSFLSEALIWHTTYPNLMRRAALQHVLNRQLSITKQLPDLINLVAIKCAPSVLNTLSSLLDDDVIEKLVLRSSGAILHLLPYKPTLLSRITEGDVTDYLAQLGALDEPVLVVIIQLLALFSALRDVNKAGAALVYEAILDRLLTQPQLLEDSYLIKQIRKFSEKEVVLTNRCAQLQFVFDRCLSEQVAMVVLTTESYHLIEDAWHSFSQQLDLLNEIMPLTSRCPADKYKLYAYLASLYLANHADYFVLDDFIQALEVTPELSADCVNEYERLLIELLTTIDDDNIRRTIIDKFASEYTRLFTERLKTIDDVNIRQMLIDKFEADEDQTLQWIYRDYGDECVFDRAVKQGNIGLIQWMEPKINRSRLAVDRSVIMAAEANQWGVANYFCSSSSIEPQQHALKELLIMAAVAGQLGTVQLLCEGAITHLREKHIAAAFIQAAAYGHKNIAQYFCNLDSRAPCADITAKALKVAIQHKSLAMIDFIGNLPRNTQLLLIVSNAVIHAATRDDLPVMQQLCSLRTNTPRRQVLEKSFLKALEFGHLTIAQYLYSLLVQASSQDIIDKAFAVVIANRDLVGVTYLCNLPVFSPSQRAIDRGFQQAVKMKCSDVVHYLYKFDKTPPHQWAIEQGFKSSAKSGDLSMMKYLGSLVSSQLIEKTTQLAAKNGQLKMVQHCCEIKIPERKAIRIALKKASSKGHEDVVNYLRGVMHPTPKHHEGLDTCTERRHVVLQQRLRPSTLDGIKKSSSCGSLSTLGLFGPKRNWVRHGSLSDIFEPKY